MVALARYDHVEAQFTTRVGVRPGRGPAEDDRAFLPPLCESGKTPDFVHLRAGGADPHLLKFAILRERVAGQVAEIGDVSLRFELRGQIP